MTFGNDAKGCFETTFLSPSIVNFMLYSNWRISFQDNSKVFHTCDNKVLKKVPKGFRTELGFKEEVNIKFLFEETFFLNEEHHFQVKIRVVTIL